MATQCSMSLWNCTRRISKGSWRTSTSGPFAVRKHPCIVHMATYVDTLFRMVVQGLGLCMVSTPPALDHSLSLRKRCCWYALHPGLFIYCAVNVFISIIARSYSQLQESKLEVQREKNTVPRRSQCSGSSDRSDDADTASATEFLGRSTVSRQSVSQMADRLTSAALNMFGSIANSLADGDDVNFVAQQDEGGDGPSDGSNAALQTLELEPIITDSQTEAVRWRRQCLAQRQIVSEARAELLQALEKMDQQLAALEMDVDEARPA